MIKTYVLKEYQCKEISSGKGSINYLLIDELGNERVVTALATLGIIKKIKSVEPIYHRETPLVEMLSKASINDTIEIDFSNFNKMNPRPSSSSKSQRIDRQFFRDINNSSHLNNSSFTDFSISPIRMLKLMAIAIASFLAFLSIQSKF